MERCVLVSSLCSLSMSLECEFLFSKLGGCEVVVSSSGIQDAASWLRKCFDCWCSFVCISDFFRFLVRFMCSQKSCSLLFFVICPLLCFVYTYSFSFSPSPSLCFLSLGEERAIHVPCGPPFILSQRRCREASDMHDCDKIRKRFSSDQKSFADQPCAGGNGGRLPSPTHCLGLTKRGHLFFPPTHIATLLPIYCAG